MPIVVCGINLDDNTVIETVSRLDYRKMGSFKKTDEGYLVGDAPIANVGIMSYLLKDGSIRKEYVPEITLFNEDSIKSLKLKPVTNSHPPEKVLDSKSIKNRKIGFTGENTHRVDDSLMINMSITDSEDIEDILNGKQELSPGYVSMTALQSGTYKGEHYDSIQLSRKYNHVAICSKARGGDNLRINLDSIDGIEINNDAVLTAAERNNLPDSAFCYVKGSGDRKIRKFPSHDAVHVRAGLSRLSQADISPAERRSVLSCLLAKAKKFGIDTSTKTNGDSFDILTENEKNKISNESKCILDSDFTLMDKEIKQSNKGKGLPMPKILVNNCEYEAEQEVINHAVTLQTKVDEITKTVTKLQANLDESTTTIASLKGRDITAEVNKQVKDRVSTVVIANDCLDDVAKLDEMSTLDIKKAVILKLNPGAKDKINGAEPVYINARFDAVIETHAASKGGEQRKTAVILAKTSETSKEDACDADKSRAKMIEELTKGRKKE